MNKEQFIAYMNKKLSIIKEEERKDIIDEYINHIDMKVADGSSEEEAIAAFGDIDEMIKEILDAYNIDPRQQGSTAFDYKVNDFLDRMFDAFRRLFSSSNNISADRIVRLLFEVLLVLILLGVIRIPFEILGSIGSGILRGIFGYGIGSTFGWMWKILANLVYLCVFIVVLVNVARRRWYRHGDSDKDIMDDFKESFNFKQAKEAVYRFTQSTTHTHSDDNPYYEDQEAQDTKMESESETSQSTTNDYNAYYDPNRYKKGESQYVQDTTSVFRIIFKVLGYFMMVPFIIMMICLCCALGFTVIMSVQGVTIFGIYFILIGAIIGVSSVLSLIDRFLCKGGKY